MVKGIEIRPAKVLSQRLLVLSSFLTLLFSSALGQPCCATDTNSDKPNQQTEERGSRRASAIFAGGCFWCIETDLEKLPGVVDVISGYSGGRLLNPTYETYASGGHREVVFVMYDPDKITYTGLVEYFIKHIDPINRGGQFNDKGFQYSPAIYYENEEEKQAAEKVVKIIDEAKVFRGKISIIVEPREAFWPAEEYHQDYHRKNSVKYDFFRAASGRDQFVQRHWGSSANVLQIPGSLPDSENAQTVNAKAASANTQATVTQTGEAEEAGIASNSSSGIEPQADDDSKQVDDSSKEQAQPWLTFRKPTATQLRRQLNAIQFKVTQQDGTEPAFRNEYWENKVPGLYVDIVSGAPLFLSTAKYDSGTGWPSFVEPVSPDAVKFKTDRKLGYPRVEVRSTYGDSHLGHVFNDGPAARGGKRYCMNSAALRFVPADQMEKEGYGEFLKLFRN